MGDAKLEELGRRIRALREERHLSQEELAYRARLHRTYVGQLELGLRNPSYLVLLRLAEALQVSIEELIKSSGWH